MRVYPQTLWWLWCVQELVGRPRSSTFLTYTSTSSRIPQLPIMGMHKLVWYRSFFGLTILVLLNVPVFMCGNLEGKMELHQICIYTSGRFHYWICIYIYIYVACGLWGLAVQSNLAQQILTTLTHRPIGRELAELCVAVVHSKQTLRGWSAINYIPSGNLT